VVFFLITFIVANQTIMKKLFLIPTAFLFSFCCSNKDTIKKNEEPISKLTIESTCPPDGDCHAEIHKNKSLEVKKDDLGSIYTNIIDNETTSVIVYQYNRKVKGDLQDAGYREEVVFEINNSDKELILNNENLQQTKMLYGRFCFCKGQTGYYKVENGNLTLKQNKDAISFNIDFSITQVPQIIKSIKIK
jgi:hypothetical protein